MSGSGYTPAMLPHNLPLELPHALQCRRHLRFTDGPLTKCSRAAGSRSNQASSQGPRPNRSWKRPLLQVSLACLALTGIPQAGDLAQSQGPRFNPRDASRMLVRAADENGDESVTAQERADFLGRVAPDPGQELSPDEILALALLAQFDSDGDRSFGAPDLQALFSRWDKNANGELSVSERLNGPRQRRLLDGLVIKALDSNQDGKLDAAEWTASADLDLAAWLGTVASIAEDPNAFGPGTMVLTLRASLDTDANGTLNGNDIVQLFNQIDSNGDGIIAAAELNASQAASSTDWSVSSKDRERQPLIPWQRSLKDAQALSVATGKPLLICVNTDGEAASERLAFGRYRDPEFAQLAAGFIPLLASPSSHTPRSIDTRGRRVECPRFGRLLCAEHIDEEPLLYERYFNGRRIAPRHVGVAPDGTILFDLVLLQDLGRIDQALREFGQFDTALETPESMEIEDLLASFDAGARAELEQRFLASSQEERIKLAARALSPTRAAQQPQLLSLALYDRSTAVRQVAAIRMTAGMAEEFVDFAPRLRWIANDDVTLRHQLIEALSQLAERTPDLTKKIRARRLARVYAALELTPAVDVTWWQLALAGAPRSETQPTAIEGQALNATLVELDELLHDNRHDPDLNGLLALTTLRLAQRSIRGEGGGNAQFFLQDASGAAQRVLTQRPDDLLAQSVLARAKWLLNKPNQAADAAAGVLPRLAPVADSALAGELLDVLAQGRTRSLYPALGTDEGWPAEWVVQAASASQILLSHPDCTEAQALAGVSLMENLEDYSIQARLIRTALAHFPGSQDLHAWLRWQVLRDGDGQRASAAALEHVYDDLPAPAGWEATWTWFQGLAQFTAAQTFAAEGDSAGSRTAYAEAQESFEHSIELNPDFSESTQSYLEKAGSALLPQ